MLEYSGIATRYGVLCEQRDDGVIITLPQTFGTYLSKRGHPIIAFAAIIVWFYRRAMQRTEPPRMIIELNRNELRISEQTQGGSPKMNTRTWPRAQVGELRANRYSTGMLVRIPGKDNFDILADCKPELVKWIGETLTVALRKTKPTSAAATSL